MDIYIWICKSWIGLILILEQSKFQDCRSLFNKRDGKTESHTLYSNPVVRVEDFLKKNNPVKILGNICELSVKLLNCGESLAKAPKISLYSTTVILKSIEVLGTSKLCSSRGRVQSVWQIWRTYEHHDESKDIPIISLYDENNLKISRNLTQLGLLKIKLTIQVSFRDYFLSEHAYCFIDLVQTPTQTTIFGGNDQNIYFKENLRFEVATFLVPYKYLSKGQSKTIYSWQCNNTEELFCREFETSESRREIPGPFKRFRSYKFTLFTQTADTDGKSTLQHAEYQTVHVVPTLELKLLLRCEKNCGGSVFKANPKDHILIEAIPIGQVNNYSRPSLTSYHWLYKEVGSDELLDVDNIMDQQNNIPYFLLIQENKLKEGGKYLFYVTAAPSSWASITIEMDRTPQNLNCSFEPTQGLRGITLFTIKCEVEGNSHLFPFHTFELLDGILEGEKFAGRHLGFSLTGVFDKILLTRGTLLVRAINFFGTWEEIQLTVMLDPPPESHLIHTPSFEGDAFNNYAHRIRHISATSDLFEKKSSSLRASNALLDNLEKEDIFDINGALLLENTLNNVACRKFATIKPTKCQVFLNIAKIMNKATKIIKNSLNNPWENTRLMSSNRVREYAESILFCSSTVLDAKQFYKTASIDTHLCLKESTFSTIDTLLDLVEIIAVAFRPIIMFELVTNSLQIKVQAYMSGQNSLSITRLYPDIQFPTKYLSFGQAIQFFVQMIRFQVNPFWWAGGNKINTNVLRVSLKNKYTEDTLDVNESLTFYLQLNPGKFQPLLISGSVKQPDPLDGPRINDFKVVIYRIDPEIQTKIFVEFLDLQNTSLRVVIFRGKRPDYDYMTTNAYSISHTFTTLSFTSEKDQSFFYLGILPGKDLMTNHETDFKFYLYGTRCAIWKYSSWLHPNEKCTASIDPHFLMVVCKCSLLTLTIGGYAYVPLNDLNPFSDIHLLLHSSDNPFVIVVLLILGILFAIFFIWARRKDLEDKTKISVITLECEGSKNSFGYLIAVFTSTRLFAGTSSIVGIKLVGEHGSKTFLLQSNDRSVFSSSSDDWFLVFSNQSLGSISKLHVWISYSGLHPNWHCAEIFICDINTFETNIFIVDRWFGANMNDVCLDMLCSSASSKEVNSFNLIFFDNLTKGLLEFPIWTSLFFRHPRSLTSRCQRLNVIACYLIVSILVSSLIHSISSPFEEDYHKFEIQWDSVMDGFISAVSANFVCWLIMYLYRRSYSINFKVNASHIHHDPEELYKLKHLRQNHSMLLRALTVFIKAFTESCKMIPVKNQENLISVKVDFKRKLQAWLLCLVVIVLSCYFIVNHSLQFGPIKTSVWLTSLMFSLVLSCFVITPIKILCIALMLSLVKTRFFKLLYHHIDIKDASKNSCHDINKRSNLDYLLSSLEHKGSYKRAHKHRQLMFHILAIGFIFESIIFLSLVFWISGELETSNHFYASFATCQHFQKYASCERVENPEVQSFFYMDTLGKDILPMLYKTKWYNQNDLSLPQLKRKIGLIDNNSRLVGVPHVRQVRVRKNLCTVPDVMAHLVKYCNPVLQPRTEDKSNYTVGWTHDGWGNILFTESPWEYSQGSGVGLKTPNNFYISEGSYVVVLSSNLERSQDVIKNLIDTRWIDEQTRVVVLEFLSYNPNTNMFTFTSLITELFPSKLVRVTASVRCNKFFKQNVTVGGIVFILFTIYFFLRQLILLNIEGFNNFFKDYWHLYDIFLVCIGIFGAANYLQLTSKVMEVGEKAYFDKERNVYLETVFKLSDDCRFYLGVVFCATTLRLIRAATLNRNCRKYLSSVKAATLEITLSVCLTFSGIYVHYRLIMYLVGPPIATSFADVFKVQSDFNSLLKEIDSTGGKICVLLLKKFTQLTIFSVTLTLVHHHKQVQSRMPIPKDQ